MLSFRRFGFRKERDQGALRGEMLQDAEDIRGNNILRVLLKVPFSQLSLLIHFTAMPDAMQNHLCTLNVIPNTVISDPRPPLPLHFFTPKVSSHYGYCIKVQKGPPSRKKWAGHRLLNPVQWGLRPMSISTCHMKGMGLKLQEGETEGG